MKVELQHAQAISRPGQDGAPLGDITALRADQGPSSCDLRASPYEGGPQLLRLHAWDPQMGPDDAIPPT